MRFIIMLLIYSIICIGPYSSWAGNNSTQKTMEAFLNETEIEKKEESYLAIISDSDKYRDIILAQLEEHVRKNNSAPDELIYLASYIKDKRYIPPLENLLLTKEYSESKCVYSCPIAFSLVIFSCFAGYSLPTNLNRNMTVISDIESQIKRVSATVLKDEKASSYVEGPGINEYLKQIETLPYSEVIKLAGPRNKDAKMRMAAAYVIDYKTVNSKYLPDLYWLAITGLKDASGEYLSAIYDAIYKAEKSKRSH